VPYWLPPNNKPSSEHEALAVFPHLLPTSSACAPASLAHLPCLAVQIYRTPFMLRYCPSLLIHIGAVVLGPYFIHIT
jgi:hypothetical protein